MTPVGYLETSVLYCDNNLHRLSQFPPESVDLIYLDPPFFSNRYYEVIWGDEAEVRSFEDRWEGGINVYVNWMRERMIEMHRILKPTGSIYLHCDHHASHYLKVMMDEIFGVSNFLNEIVWRYRKWSNKTYRFQRNHDTLLFYSRTGSRDRIDISPTAVNLVKKRVEKEGATNVKLVGMPVTEADLKTLKPLEFQNWVIQRLNGSYSRRGGDMGIDGFSFMYHYPIQVKQSERVGRPVLDAFEAAIERTGKDRGYVVAFSFTKGAHEEVARVKRARGLEIELVRVADLLEDVSELVTPDTGQLLGDLPLPKAPPKAARPSVEELIESDQQAT